MLIHPQRDHPDQPLGLVDTGSGLNLHGVPQRVPVHPKMPRQRRHGGVVMGQGVDRPPHRAGGELGPWPSQRMSLRERLSRTSRLGAPPHPLAPHHH